MMASNLDWILSIPSAASDFWVYYQRWLISPVVCISDTIYYQIPFQIPKFFIPRIGVEVLFRGSHTEHQQPLRKAPAKLDCGQPSFQQGFHRGIPLRVRAVQRRQSMHGHLESELAKPMRWCSISKGILIPTLSQISSIAHSSKTEESLGH